jgi:drug/metabolite transporter (DMT)-like permease
LRRRRPSLLIWLATVLALSGVVLTVGPIGLRMHSAALDPFGVTAILVSALCYAGYIVLSERPVAKHGPLVSTAIITSGTSVGFTLLGLLTGWLTQPPSWLTLGYGLAMALLGGVLAMGTFLAGITRVGPTIASLISTLEPVFTVLLAMLILHETLATHQVAGGVFILAAVLLITAPRRLKVRQR